MQCNIMRLRASTGLVKDCLHRTLNSRGLQGDCNPRLHMTTKT